MTLSPRTTAHFETASEVEPGLSTRARRTTPPSGTPAVGVVRHVLVCLDRSATAASCIAQASTIARAFDARVTLTHVMPSSSGPRLDALEWEIERRECERYLGDLRASIEGELPHGVSTMVTQGAPADRIVATAKEIGADLVILSSHGAHGDADAPLGDTAQRVLTLASGSVLLVHPTGCRVPPSHIVVPLDGSARTEAVLPAVITLARASGAEVSLVHVVCDRGATAMLSDPADLELSRRLSERVEISAVGYLERTKARVLHDLPVVHTVVRRSADERRGILEAAQEAGADLIVLAAHGTTCNAEHTFGNVASYLLSRAPTPVLVLQDLEPRVRPYDCAGLARPPIRNGREGN